MPGGYWATLVFKEGGLMLRGGDVNEIQELRRQGLSITQIGTLTGFDRKTGVHPLK